MTELERGIQNICSTSIYRGMSASQYGRVKQKIYKKLLENYYNGGKEILQRITEQIRDGKSI